MSTAALWLLPPSTDHPFSKSLANLITGTVPTNFPDAHPPDFSGHVTLTPKFDASSTYKSAEEAQSWLDALKLPPTPQTEKEEAVIEFMELEADDTFFRKLTLRARPDANLLNLAGTIYAQVHTEDESAAQQWAREEYKPHLSLMYADMGKHDVELKMHKVELQLGFEFGELFACCGGQLAQGCRLALVDVSSGQDVAAWKVLAERPIQWVVWKAARALV